ncbi:hypothetical protein SERLADRAFT_364688 [Serpula lacrymans var. lacrymans S7.9]|uniref:26S proteasome regulatory subunit RPN2 n=1 Tax=Serpula lacrymans var. lacrymans (strain S7.9) TaxID=578457 RepID=F8NFY6_SERL9|nr:uncharacterized protein SERLADRAFT_364688 [Serpula lacrymans var. lacrymans S7.9]EGO30956.1 hypothetical protein SERLADRAFT_364688 [Serpula lacrymans var. lacrymans S7.9]
MVVRTQSSAAGVLALLSEPEPAFKQHALKALNSIVPQFWAEISEHIALIESLHESDEISADARDSAALLASKVYYFLGEYDEALSFALGAGSAFQTETHAYGSEEYVETVVSKAIDRYIQLRSDASSDKQSKIDPRLQHVVEGIFSRCIADGEYKQAIGIALESRRLDIIAQIYKLTREPSLLSYAMEAVLDTGFSLSYRDQVLNFLLPLFPQPTMRTRSPHIHALTRLLVTLSNPSLALPILTSLVPKETLLAYQFAFDLVEGGAQDFLEALRKELPEGQGETKEVYDKLRSILGRSDSVKLYLEFLKRNNKVDLLILKNTKEALEPRSSIYHTALTLQNAFMHAGTTSDIFLRENLEWLGMASNWSKFSATAALGVIHKGYFQEGMAILGPYLPQAGGESQMLGASYSEGGALYALGLINASCGSGGSVETYLRDTLKASQGEVVQHGAALGLGVVSMGGKNADAYDDLKQTLFTDSAVAGEAAGYSMGLVMLGTANATCADEMLTYARETQHEKIIRGLAVGLAFIYYGRQEEANETIKSLLAEKDPILRYGGVYTLALAYAGTSNNDAIRQLLHIAVSDTSDDVRRAAVTSLAFLLFKNPSQVPRIVQLLSESYNPHVRCGATLALGIACAGTGLQDAIEILEPMTKDSVDFVRQGAFIALGMVLVQQSEASSPSMSSTRALYAKVISDKHEDPMARFGAAIGQGFIDAGGRNVTISLQSRAGSRNTSAIVGMVLFCQFWYWYPLAHCACLAFEPTGIIGLNGDLKAPVFEYVSNARPSLFAYPSPTKPPKKETVAKVATAVLSTTARVKAREKRKAAAEVDAMETDEKPESKKESDVDMKSDEALSGKHGDVSPINESMSTFVEESKASTSTKRKEPTSERLPNFSRVTPAQWAHIAFPRDGRYQPVRAVSANTASSVKGGKAAAVLTGGLLELTSERYAGGGGILIMVDERPDEEAEFISFDPPAPPPVVEVEVPNGNAIVGAPSHNPINIALDESSPEVDPPDSFEHIDTISDEDSLVKRLLPYTIICAMRERTKFTASLLARLGNLKFIATTGPWNAGIDVAYAEQNGIVVSGTGAQGNSTLEHIWALILGTVRYVPMDDADVKARNSRWQTRMPMGLAGRTLGVVGLGRLGSQTAQIAKAFGMRVVAWSPNLTSARAEAAGCELSSKKELFQNSDVVSIHIVSSPRTRHLISAADLSIMKPSAFFINTSRGPIVNEDDLIDVLQRKTIAGAGLDVFDIEPLPLEHPFRNLDNVVLTPHTGYVSDSNYEAIWGQTVENIVKFLDGKPSRILKSS